MDNLLYIALEAHEDERNIHRRYAITLGRDLLGAWTVAIDCGRVGGAMRRVRLSAASESEAIATIRARLRRRASAPRRLGCEYSLCLVESHARRIVRSYIDAVTTTEMVLEALPTRWMPLPRNPSELTPSC